MEALSRGAVHATFVDRSRQMCSLIQFNLELCRIEENDSKVVQLEALDYLRRTANSSRQAVPWDIVFFDPPYADDHLPTLKAFGAHTADLFTENGLLIVEHHHKNVLPDEIGNLHRYRVLKQGDSALSFFAVSSVNERAALFS